MTRTQNTPGARRTSLGAETEELLNQRRNSDRALRLSDLDGEIADLMLKVAQKKGFITEIPEIPDASIVFAKLALAMVRTGAETIAADETDDDELTTVKAVADFVRGLILPGAPLASWTWSTDLTSIPLTGLAGWDSVELVASLAVSATNTVRLQVSPDNGATWRTTGYETIVWDTGGNNGLTDGMGVSRVSAAANLRGLRLNLAEMADAAVVTTMNGNVSHSGASKRGALLSGEYLTPELCTAIRLTGATFTGGWARVYGKRRG